MKHVCRRTLPFIIWGVLSCTADETAHLDQDLLEIDMFLLDDCPFANEMLEGLLPATSALQDSVSFRVHTIGRSTRSDNDKILGCAQKHLSSELFSSFLRCKVDSKTFGELESCVQDDRVRTCAAGPESDKILAADSKLAASRAVSASPTLLLNGERYSGGRTEDFLAKAVCDRVNQPASYCSERPTAPIVRATIVFDSRCRVNGCKGNGLEGFLRYNLLGLDLKRIDVNPSVSTKSLKYSDIPQEQLPGVVFDQSIHQTPAFLARLKSHLFARPDGEYLWAVPL